MATVYQIRGTNGSGKSTLVRAFIEGAQEVELMGYPAPTKKDPDKGKAAGGYYNAATSVAVIGPYRTATGGLDALPSFAIQQRLITLMSVEYAPEVILCEGVLASTVAGSWFAYADHCVECGLDFALVYLTTPLAVCLERIKARQCAAGREREIKEDQVTDKVRAIAATRTKALRDGRRVYDLPWEGETTEAALRAVMKGEGEKYRA